MKATAMTRFVLGGVFLLSAPTLFAQWNWQSPLPQGNSLLHVQFIDTSLGWAVGEDGTILHTSTGGASWYEQEYARTDNVLSVSMTSATEGWAAGDDGVILHTTDSGDDWLEQNSGISSGLNSVVFLDPLNGWAAGDKEIILHTTDGGTSWVRQHQNLNPTTVLNAIAFVSVSEGWAVGADRRVYHTIDSGTIWTPRIVGAGLSASYLSVAFVDPSFGFIAGTGGEIYRTTDGGMIWSAVSSGDSTNLNQIIMQNSFVGWCAGDHGKILRTINGGLSWSTVVVGDSNDYDGIARVGGKLWAVGTLGKIIESTNGGASWFSLDSGSRLSVNWIDFPTGSTGTAVGQNGLILRTIDGGAAWLQEISPSSSISYYGVKFTDANHGWAVGDNGTIIRTSDGVNWSTQPSSVMHSLFGVTFGSSSAGWIVGGEGLGFTGVILNSTNAGASWHIQYNGVPHILYGVSFPDAATGWAVGEQGLILHTTNGGAAWTTQTAGTTAALFWCSFIDGNRGWAVGESGMILQTTNGGSSWVHQSSGVSGTLYSISHVSSIEAFIAGDEGVVLHTTDAGVHWENQYSRTLSSLFSVWSPGGNSVWACGDYGTILENTLPFTGGAITGLLYYDVNNNGVYDTAEPSLAGWRVKIQGAKADSALTINDGTFAFHNLPYGAYTLGETVQPSWIQTSPSTPGSYTFTLSPDSAAFSGYFGNYAGNARAYGVNASWNILSLPLRVDDSRVSSLYPAAISPAFAYMGAYQIQEMLSIGVGYWIKFPASQTVWISGLPVSDDTIDVQPGWNMIGSLSDSVPVGTVITNPSGIVASNFFAYNPGYATMSVLAPGKGYWVKALQAGKLLLHAGASSPKKPGMAPPDDEALLASMNRLTIRDARGSQKILYFGAGAPNSGLLQSRALPPLPPQGGFDARFRGDRDIVLFPAAGSGSGSAAITIQSSYFPLRASWHLGAQEGLSYELAAGGTGNLISGMEGDSGTVAVTAADAQSMLLRFTRPSDAGALPTEFALLQNSPNPFNPSTCIRYSIPSTVFVSLKVYDLLGREVATLVDEMRPPGAYQAEWNATNLPSGVYLYRLAAGSFFGVKKMALIR